jgi:hypothetical protein
MKPMMEGVLQGESLGPISGVEPGLQHADQGGLRHVAWPALAGE